MTLEEIFYDLDRQYGDSFSWRMLPLTDRSFAAELKREIGESHPLWGRRLWAVATTGRCISPRTGNIMLSTSPGRDTTRRAFPAAGGFPGSRRCGKSWSGRP